MKIIEIEPLENGAHDNQESSVEIQVPEGWAVIPDDMEIPDTFPFISITVDDGIVTSMKAGVVPDPEPDHEPDPGTDPEPSGEYVTYRELAAAIREGVNAV